MIQRIMALFLIYSVFRGIINIYKLLGGFYMSSILNATKRELTCQFCPKRRPECTCKKFWKEIYTQNRNSIIKIYHDSKKPQ